MDHKPFLHILTFSLMILGYHFSSNILVIISLIINYYFIAMIAIVIAILVYAYFKKDINPAAKLEFNKKEIPLWIVFLINLGVLYQYDHYIVANLIIFLYASLILLSFYLVKKFSIEE